MHGWFKDGGMLTAASTHRVRGKRARKIKGCQQSNMEDGRVPLSIGMRAGPRNKGEYRKPFSQIETDQRRDRIQNIRRNAEIM